MKLSTNRWHYHLASLLTPIGFIILVILLIFQLDKNIEFKLISILILELISLIAQILFLVQADRKRIEVSNLETSYCILVFIIYCPIYILSAFLLYGYIINKI